MVELGWVIVLARVPGGREPAARIDGDCLTDALRLLLAAVLLNTCWPRLVAKGVGRCPAEAVDKCTGLCTGALGTAE